MDDARLEEMPEVILRRAVDERADDIHLVPDTNSIFFRVDGELHEVFKPPCDLFPRIVGRFFQLADLSLEGRSPQYGRIHFEDRGRVFNLRATTSPGEGGQKLVLTFLDYPRTFWGLSSGGFSVQAQEDLTRSATRPKGLLVIAGEHDSGRTSTLYRLIDLWAQEDRVTLSIENPRTSFPARSMRQIDLREPGAESFESALATLKDKEILALDDCLNQTNARNVFQVMRERPVMATLEAKNLRQALGRLTGSLGLGQDDLSAGLLNIFFQKKVRLLCDTCKKPMQAAPEMLSRYGLPPDAEVFTSAGCDYCNMQGYRGACVIHEGLYRPEDFQRLLGDPQWRPTPSMLDDAAARVRDGFLGLSDLSLLEP